MENVVLYPSPGMGHLISMVELGKLIIKHHPSLSITILTITAPFDTGATVSYISAVSATTPSINFHHLPTTPLPQDPSSYPSFEAISYELLTIHNPNVHQALRTISGNSNVLALVIDFFCTPALAVAEQLNIPAYYFFTSSSAGLALFLYIPTLHRNNTQSFNDIMNTLHQVPGLPPIPSADMPEPLMDQTSKEYESFLYYTTHAPKSAGIIVNTFESLEPKALKAVRDGLCVTDSPTPPVFSIGPLIATHGGDGGEHGKKCLKWLDSQPKRSVVFLCFGSMGFFSEEQLKEIAVGLERSGQRFLWVVRNPPPKDQSQRFLASPEPDLDSLLPDGFLERTKERGLVVKSWAPQVAVLSHISVGGFVTHCGWNSVLEAVSSGVPMVGWPLYAEQRFNKFVLVEELKIALAMEESEEGLVTAIGVEKRVRELMETEKGFSIRSRLTALKEEAMAAIIDGGSSLAELDKLIKLWRKKMNHVSSPSG